MGTLQLQCIGCYEQISNERCSNAQKLQRYINSRCKLFRLIPSSPIQHHFTNDENSQDACNKMSDQLRRTIYRIFISVKFLKLEIPSRCHKPPRSVKPTSPPSLSRVAHLALFATVEAFVWRDKATELQPVSV